MRTPTLNQIPGIGPWFARVGVVTDIMASPCQPTPMMWAQGFFTAIPYLAWSLFKPDPIDLTLSRFGLKGATHRHARFKLGGSIRGLLQPIGKGLKGTVLWEIGELAQKVGWWFCIIDAGTEFAVNWTSATYQYAGCLPGNEPASFGNCPVTTIIAPGESSYVPIYPLQDEAGRFTYNGIKFRYGDPTGYAINPVVGPWPAHPELQGSVNLDIRRKDTGQVLSFWPPVVNNTGEDMKLSHFTPNYGRNLHAAPYEIGLHAKNTSQGYVSLIGTTFVAQNSIGNNILEDPI